MSDGTNIPLNFNSVTNRLLVGSRPRSLADIATLRWWSVSHILDVCMTDDTVLLGDKQWMDCGIVDYRYNPTGDDGQPKPADWFRRSLRFALPVLAEPGWIIYVHCYDGINRGPSTAYAILRAQGLSPWQARFLIDFNRPIDLAGLRYAGDAEKALLEGW